MTRKPALDMSFTPDDYLVTWQLPTPAGGTVDAHGALTVEAGKPPKGSAHGSFDGHLDEMASGVIGFPQSVQAPVVTGNLSNGANVLLVNARVAYWFSGQARIDADAAIITLAHVSASGEALFKSFEIQIGGLDAIAGVRPIKSTTFPQKGAAGTWAAELAADFSQDWNDLDASLNLTYYGSFRSFDPYAFSMSFSPVLSCELAEPVSLRHLLDDWINPLRRIVSIGTGRAEEITYLTVSRHGRGGEAQGPAVRIGHHPGAVRVLAGGDQRNQRTPEAQVRRGVAPRAPPRLAETRVGPSSAAGDLRDDVACTRPTPSLALSATSASHRGHAWARDHSVVRQAPEEAHGSTR